MRLTNAASLASWIFPERCFACRAVGGDCWCGACRSQLRELQGPLCPRCGAPDGPATCADCRRFEPLFDSAVSCYYYEGSLRVIMLAYKYRGYRRLAGPLGLCMRPALETMLQPGAVVIPVPSDPVRRWRRGFNPAELIAASALQGMEHELVTGVLTRRHGGPPQVGLGRAVRRSNAAGRFRVRDSGPIRGRSVVLADDVFTTGSTCSEAARVLKEAGASRVDAITLARD